MINNPDYVRTLLERVIPFCDLKTLIKLTEVCRWCRTYINKNKFILHEMEKEVRGTSYHKYKCWRCFKQHSLGVCEMLRNDENYLIKKILYDTALDFESSEERYETRRCFG